MAWRSKYVDWYRETERSLEGLAPRLEDREVVDAVEAHDEANIRLGGEERPSPSLHLKVRDEGVTIAVRYDSKKSLDHLARILDEVHSEQRRSLFENVKSLDARYQTRLYAGAADDRPELTRSYLAGRLDEQLLSRLLEEAGSMRKGGTTVEYGRSVYRQPRSPLLHLAEVSTPLDPAAYRDAASRLGPLLGVLLDIKTQREIIKERLERPRVKANRYRDYVEALNRARREGLISAERRRDLDRLWRDSPSDRDSLMAELDALLSPRDQGPK
jgi:hypothetical protein